MQNLKNDNISFNHDSLDIFNWSSMGNYFYNISSKYNKTTR